MSAAKPLPQRPPEERTALATAAAPQAPHRPAQRLPWGLAAPLALTVAALALRAFGIDWRGLWYDEAYSVYLAKLDLAQMVSLTAQDIHPPLYYGLLHFWLLFWGDGEAAVRGLSAASGVLGVPLAYVLGARVGGRRLGAAVGALVAASPFLILYSQETRMYTLLCTLVLAAGLFAWRAAALAPARVWAPGYVVAAALAAYTHNTALLALGGLNAAYLIVALPALWRRWRHRARPSPVSALAAWVACQAAIALLLAPWLPALWAQNERYVKAGGGSGLPELLVASGRAFVVGEVPPAGSEWVGTVAWLAVVGGLALALRRGWHDPAARGAVFAAVWLVVAVALLYVNAAGKRDFSPRYLTAVLPAFYLLLGTLLAEAWRAHRLLGALALGATALVVGAALQTYYADPYDDRPDQRSPVQAFAAAAQPGDVAILDAGYAFPVFQYYYRGEVPYVGLPASYPPDRAATEEALAELAGRYRRAWLFLWQDYYADPEGVVDNWLRNNHLAVSEQEYYGQVRLKLYELRRPGDTVFGGAVRLEGYEIVDLRAGWEAKVRLRWRCLAPLPADYQVFVHLVDDAYNFYGQHDGAPNGGASPTSTWRPGDLIADEHVIRIPPEAAGRELAVRVGLYSLADGKRLATGSGDHLLLARVKVKSQIGN